MKIVGAQAWTETAPGRLEWVGTPPPTTRVIGWQAGDRVRLRRGVQRGRRRYPAGTVATVVVGDAGGGPVSVDVTRHYRPDQETRTPLLIDARDLVTAE